MKNKLLPIIASALVMFLITLILLKTGKTPKTENTPSPSKEERVWQIKSIDTMKYSRDLSLEKLNDPLFDKTIDSQMKAIKDLGANYVAIATPYDEKFSPILARWVAAARKYNLHVWFRGNFSGWEGWFGKEKSSLSRDQHLQLTKDFIKTHANLFENGDIFSPCPECENGGPGDPRQNGDVESFRKFMIDEHNAADEEFTKIGKKVQANFASMNFDVASLVMDRETTVAMGNLIVIDHYVKSPQKLSSDIDNLTQKTGAQVFLGEIGAPIPDITGDLSPQQQANWTDEALMLVSKKPSVIGINYWVLTGGQTALLNDDLTSKPVAEIVKKYFLLTEYN